MQPGSGGSDRAGAIGIHRLVALAVGGLVRLILALDVGRQGHLPDAVHQCDGGLRRIDTPAPFASCDILLKYQVSLVAHEG